MQFLIDLEEGTMSITNVELRISAESIKKHFKGSLSPQFWQRRAKMGDESH